MLRHYWTVLTKKSYVDQDTNVIVLGESVEEVQMMIPKRLENQFNVDIASGKTVPLPFEYEFVSYLGNDEKSGVAKIEAEMVLPNGQTIKLIEQLVEFKEGKKVRNRVKSNVLNVSGSGVNTFRLLDVTEHKRRVLTELPISITVNFK